MLKYVLRLMLLLGMFMIGVSAHMIWIAYTMPAFQTSPEEQAEIYQRMVAEADGDAKQAGHPVKYVPLPR